MVERLQPFFAVSYHAGLPGQHVNWWNFETASLGSKPLHCADRHQSAPKFQQPPPSQGWRVVGCFDCRPHQGFRPVEGSLTNQQKPQRTYAPGRMSATWSHTADIWGFPILAVGGAPKSPILIGFSIIKHSCGGTIQFVHLFLCVCHGAPHLARLPHGGGPNGRGSSSVVGWQVLSHRPGSHGNQLLRTNLQNMGNSMHINFLGVDLACIYIVQSVHLLLITWMAVWILEWLCINNAKKTDNMTKLQCQQLMPKVGSGVGVTMYV